MDTCTRCLHPLVPTEKKYDFSKLTIVKHTRTAKQPLKFSQYKQNQQVKEQMQNQGIPAEVQDNVASLTTIVDQKI